MRFLLTALLLCPALAAAQQLHTFKSGEVADAEEINQNFSMATQKLYSGDSYVGRIIPWRGDTTLVLNLKGYFSKLAIYTDSARLEWSGSGSVLQKIFFTSNDCYGLGCIAARSISPTPSLYKGALGHVYARQTQPEDPGDGFSPQDPPDTRELLYVTYSQPLEPSVLPPNTYAWTYEGDCISEQPLADMILCEEKPNDPSVSGYNFGLELPNPSIDIGL